jgi:hypothetical protein
VVGFSPDNGVRTAIFEVRTLRISTTAAVDRPGLSICFATLFFLRLLSSLILEIDFMRKIQDAKQD